MPTDSTAPRILLRQPDPAGRPAWAHYRPGHVLRAETLSAVVPCLAEAAAAARRGRCAVGWIAYEAAAAFDGALRTHPPVAGLPLAWFALCEPPRFTAELPAAAGPAPELRAPAWDRTPEAFLAAVGRIREYIAAGETYQVNFTQRLRARLAGAPAALFAAVCGDAPPAFAALLETPDRAVLSWSPELFFELLGEEVTCRPMKGTAARGPTAGADEAAAAALRGSAKDRAENAMIVDMIRNDLGRVARPGSVAVRDVFAVERLPTVLQMTSTVTARTDAGLPELFAALFPCASITGAPKVRTMQIIRELEPNPRGLYTGCLGVLGPGRRARFSVAIRTAVVDRAGGALEYGAGGGIVWDSEPAAELAEARLKAVALQAPPPRFELLETLLHKRGRYWLLERHLARLAASAAYFQRPLDPGSIRAALAAAAAAFGPGRTRVRLLVNRRGEPTVEAQPLARPPRRTWRLALAPEPVRSDNPFLQHKTTHRRAYDAARAACPAADEVLLHNERGELTEGTIANLVLRLDGALVTPAAAAGLLPGTLRGRLLERGTLREAVVRPADLLRAEALYLINSVRGWQRAALAPEARAALQARQPR
jgi:para-aminobenzoate synthetase/4-amino-4-deoxychorismate lyase